MIRFPFHMNTKSVNDLVQPVSGAHSEAGRLAKSDTVLALTLQTAKGLGDKSGLSGDWSGDWHRQWDHVGGILDRLRGLLSDMEGFVERGDEDSLRRAMETWRSVQSQDVEMNQAMDGIRSQASGLSGDAPQQWSEVNATIAAHMETVHARALALRVKLELMKDYTKNEVSHMLEGMLSKLPNHARSDTMDAEAYVQQYRQTIHELDEERHEFGGFMDFIKGLAMWVETPDERMKKRQPDEGKRT